MSVKTHKGYLVGPRIDVVNIVELLHEVGFSQQMWITGTAIVLSESNGYTHARCENFIDGVHVSTDFGLAEINVDVKDQTDDLIRKLYDPKQNLERMFQMWRVRSWKPWHGYTSGIALGPDMKGKYLQRAIWGVMNYQRRLYGLKGVPSPYILGGARRLTWWLEHPEAKS